MAAKVIKVYEGAGPSKKLIYDSEKQKEKLLSEAKEGKRSYESALIESRKVNLGKSAEQFAAERKAVAEQQQAQQRAQQRQEAQLKGTKVLEKKETFTLVGDGPKNIISGMSTRPSDVLRRTGVLPTGPVEQFRRETTTTVERPARIPEVADRIIETTTESQDSLILTTSKKQQSDIGAAKSIYGKLEDQAKGIFEKTDIAKRYEEQTGEKLQASTPFALFGPSKLKYVKPVGQAIIRGGEKAFETLKKSKIAKSALGGAAVVGGVELGVESGQYLLESKEQKQRRPVVSTFYSDVGAELSRDIAEQGFTKQLAFGVTQAGTKKQFENILEEQLTIKGFTGVEREQIKEDVLRERKYAIGKETAQLFTLAGATEVFGSKLLVKSFAKAPEAFTQKEIFGKTLRKTAPSLFVAGAYEGAGQQIIQARARGQEVKFKEVGLGAAFGSVSAPLLGAPIAAFGASGSKKAAKVLTGAAYIGDPFEFGGDVLAKGYTQASARIRKAPIITPTLTQEKKGDKFKFGIMETTPKSFFSIPKITLPFNVPVEKPTTKPKTDVYKFITPTETFNLVPQVPTPAETFTETQIKTPTFSFSYNIPTITPQLKIPPPLPFQLPFDFSPKAVGKGKRKKYVSELEESQKILRSLLR